MALDEVIEDLSEVAGVDPATIRDHFVASGAFDLLEDEEKKEQQSAPSTLYLTRDDTTLYTTPTAALGVPIAGGRILHGSGDVIEEGRRRVKTASGGDDLWVSVSDIDPMIETKPTVKKAVRQFSAVVGDTLAIAPSTSLKHVEVTARDCFIFGGGCLLGLVFGLLITGRR